MHIRRPRAHQHTARPADLRRPDANRSHNSGATWNTQQSDSEEPAGWRPTGTRRQALHTYAYRALRACTRPPKPGWRPLAFGISAANCLQGPFNVRLGAAMVRRWL